MRKFDEAKHPRGVNGHFAAVARAASAYAEYTRRKASKLNSLDSQADSILNAAPPPVTQDTPHPRPVAPVETGRRSLARGTSAWRIGSKMPGLPVEYTGSAAHELPIGSFSHHAVQWQKPKAVTVTNHKALLSNLAQTIQANREGTVANATIRKLIPEGTERRSIHRAYNHASMLALHDFGVLDYDFKMDDHLKAEMQPLEGFMRYSRRRVIDQMRAQHKSAWRPYRKEFGLPFPSERVDRKTGVVTKLPEKRDMQTGEIRLRTRPNQVLIKRDLSQAELMQRREAARARWQRAGVSKAKLRATMQYPEVGATLSPKQALDMMRQWGRTHRTERIIMTNGAMTHVVGRGIGGRNSVAPEKYGDLVAHGPLTLIHNHPIPTPLSIPDAASLVYRPFSIAQAELQGQPKEEIDALKATSPDFNRIMAADSKGGISSLSLKVSAEEAVPHIKRAEHLHGLMVQRAFTRAMEKNPEANYLAVHRAIAVKYAPMAHGHWRELARKGIVNYSTTGKYSEAGARAGERIVRLGERLNAIKAANITAKGNEFALGMLPDIIKQLKALKLFKFDGY